MNTVCCITRFLALSAFIGLAVVTLQVAADSDKKIYMFDIEAGSLQKTLLEYSKQADVVVVSSAETLRGKTNSGVFGYLTREVAIRKLLENSGLEHFVFSDSVIHINLSKKETRTNQNVPEYAQSIAHDRLIETVTVTGSHIKGLKNSVTPVVTFTREEIKRSGAKTISEYLHKLPQFFAGGASEYAGGEITGKHRELNMAGANSVSLYGTGYDSTLVLLNGHRLAPVGEGDIVDVSKISINTIDRIEILAGGASAIYGTDAIGGVVNIILRKDYTGNETHIGYSSVTSGSHENYYLNHVLGHQWESGSALVSYGYQDRSNLNVEDREATENAIITFNVNRKERSVSPDILGASLRQDLLVSASQQVWPDLDLYVDGFYSSQESELLQGLVGSLFGLYFPGFWQVSVDQYQTVLGGQMQFSNNWNIDTNVLYSGNKTRRQRYLWFNPVKEDLHSNSTIKNSLWEFKSLLSGKAFDAWGGDANFAVGIIHREERFNPHGEWFYDLGRVASPFFPAYVKPQFTERSVSAFFQEINIPIIEDNNKMIGIDKLQVTLAGRYDKYDDIGDIFNPRLGLFWSPGWGVNIQSVWSQSFKAPQFWEKNCTILCLKGNREPYSSYITNSRSSLERTPVLFVHAYPELKPERARQWTLYVDYTPTHLKNFNINAEYFSIDYFDRIEMLFSNREVQSDEYTLSKEYLPLAIMDPDISLIRHFTSLPNYDNHEGIDDNEIKALIHLGQTNLSSIKQRGLNVSLSYMPQLFEDEIFFSFYATYLFGLQKKVYQYSPAVDDYNKPYHPIDLKLKSSISWRKNKLLSNISVNYVDSYMDRRGWVSHWLDRKVSSWTTVDVNFQYGLRLHNSFEDTSILISISNLFDRAPPFVEHYTEYNYDATNANAIGRKISIELSQSW